LAHAFGMKRLVLSITKPIQFIALCYLLQVSGTAFQDTKTYWDIRLTQKTQFRVPSPPCDKV